MQSKRRQGLAAFWEIPEAGSLCSWQKEKGAGFSALLPGKKTKADIKKLSVHIPASMADLPGSEFASLHLPF